MANVKVSQLPEKQNLSPNDDLMIVDNELAVPVNKKTSIQEIADSTYNLNLNKYQPGDVIETLTSVCDGTTVTVKSGRYSFANILNTQEGTAAFETVTGSSINYTPPSGTNRVKYQFDFHANLTNDTYSSGLSHFVIRIDDVEILPSARTIALAHYNFADAHPHDMLKMQYVINCNAPTNSPEYGSFTSWTQPKKIDVGFRLYSTSYNLTLHYNRWWNGTGSSAWPAYQIAKPTLTIQAIA